MRIVSVIVAAVLLAGVATSAQQAPMTTHGNLAQLMRGIFFPSSNIIFSAQGTDPTTIKPAQEPSAATDPLQSSYGGWEAVQNAGFALADGANLLLIPGRKCSNGRDVPITDPEWAKFVQALKDAGVVAAKAAQSRSLDNMLAAADTMTTACSDCHDRYREKPRGAVDRCM